MHKYFFKYLSFVVIHAKLHVNCSITYYSNNVKLHVNCSIGCNIGCRLQLLKEIIVHVSVFFYKKYVDYKVGFNLHHFSVVSVFELKLRVETMVHFPSLIPLNS